MKDIDFFHYKLTTILAWPPNFILDPFLPRLMPLKMKIPVNSAFTGLSAEKEELDKFGKTLLFLALQRGQNSSVSEFETFYKSLTKRSSIPVN